MSCEICRCSFVSSKTQKDVSSFLQDDGEFGALLWISSTPNEAGLDFSLLTPQLVQTVLDEDGP
ncbi:hypothetical protein WG66_012025 [Moniliophthora roreri]|nr:hypothetical protein WG66_012025 [Moniliophthora roreri]